MKIVDVNLRPKDAPLFLNRTRHLAQALNVGLVSRNVTGGFRKLVLSPEDREFEQEWVTTSFGVAEVGYRQPQALFDGSVDYPVLRRNALAAWRRGLEVLRERGSIEIEGLADDLSRWEMYADFVEQPMGWLSKRSRKIEVDVVYRASDRFMETEAHVVWPDGSEARKTLWRTEGPQFPFISLAFPATKVVVGDDRIEFADKGGLVLGTVSRG